MSTSTDIALNASDWQRLAEMRQRFLAAGDAEVALPDYWHSRRDLEIYDATFGARIRWKWDAVLSEIARRKIEIPRGVVCDWGAGTGVAARALFDHFGAEGRSVHYSDRSNAACTFARERTLLEQPAAQLVPSRPSSPDVLLASHVLDELDEAGLEDLLVSARAAQFFVWVESGSKRTARALSAARERLLDVFDPLLPCTHRAACGVLAEERAHDWCHHFATPAPEAFTTNHWRTFSRTLGIDLRALPYAYFVARRRDATPLPFEGAVRVIGSPRVEKGRASFLACGADGVRDRSILARTDKAFFKALEDRAEQRLLRLEGESERVSGLTAL